MSASLHEAIHTPLASPADQLLAAVNQTRALLEGHTQNTTGSETEAEANPASSSPLARIVEVFQLSPFESDTLLLCTAAELDPDVPALCALLQNDQRLRFPTFRLAMQVFPNAHWSAFLPQGSLRHWRLLETGAGEALTSAPLRIDESILHFLMGAAMADERVESYVETIDPPSVMPGSYRAHAEALLELWREDGPIPVAILQGNGGKDKRRVAAAACGAAGYRLRLLQAARLPATPSERIGLLRLLEREAALERLALLIEVEHGPGEWEHASKFAERFQGIVLIATTASVHLTSREVVAFSIDRPAPDEQRALWSFALGARAEKLDGDLDRISGQFSLETGNILATSQRILRLANGGGELLPFLWESCRAESRPLLEGLAQRVVTNAHWEDIVLPEPSLEMLRTIAAQLRQQGKVLRHWGFASRDSRGLGIAALFHGQSGTGKTLAAEVLANELNLDLFRIDLSQVVSKYIGETEKNLRAIFEAAEKTGAVLLFDEADALFGKRSEVRDSHDRYANIEVSYLLQRMESYRGLALLTTNMRSALDQAFLRRIRFVVPFPFPDLAQRKRIWGRMFPAGTPLQGLDYDKLARLNLPGGNIRNIALNAAYLAAEANEGVTMRHLLTAARRESNKLERSLSDTEIGGWQ